MAIDIFVKFEGTLGNAQTINGETRDAAMKGYIEVQAINFGMENPITIGSTAGGAGSGKARFHDVEIRKAVDTASPLLFQALVSGSHYETATVAFRQTSGGKPAQPYYTVTFKNVFVKNIDVNASDGDDVLVETLKLAVGAIILNYRKQSPDGTLDQKAVMAQWSQITNNSKL